MSCCSFPNLQTGKFGLLKLLRYRFSVPLCVSCDFLLLYFHQKDWTFNSLLLLQSLLEHCFYNMCLNWNSVRSKLNSWKLIFNKVNELWQRACGVSWSHRLPVGLQLAVSLKWALKKFKIFNFLTPILKFGIYLIILTILECNLPPLFELGGFRMSAIKRCTCWM